jgi:transcription antitermination protein NusB
MISRRNIRIKVMQTLYAVETSERSITITKAGELLESYLDQTRQLFVYLVHLVTEVAGYAETEAKLRASKHLPTAEDLKVNIKVAGNELLLRILEDQTYKKAVRTYRPENLDNKELTKKLFQQLATSEEYKNYISVPERDKKEEKNILEFIFSNLMLPNELVIAEIEETFIHWDDDAEMMNQMMLNFLQKPASFNFQELISLEKMEFAKQLLLTCIDKKEYCLELIKPKLKNWDSERIALLDMIIMRMGICEFLFFETIPAKVTINEYIDLAKDYSTPQSGQFVNGILDNIHKELLASNKLQKVEYKKQ